MNNAQTLPLHEVTDDERILAAQKLYSDQWWRLNHLYWIRDKKGQRVKFVLNTAQERLYNEQWYLNTILKARQLGFSTLIDILILDTCLFNPDVKAGIIAHHKDDATAIFQEKIKYPYDNLDPFIKQQISASTDRAGELAFSNGSSVRVSTSFRSGTLQLLHVSELGKIASKYPEKAREIRTGAFEALEAGQRIFVESTAEGREGEFYDMCNKAKALKDSHATLTTLDFKFHFYPWHENPEYVLPIDNVVFTRDDLRYFQDLEGRGITLTPEQQAWWIKKHGTLLEDMFREHPSYPEEAFKASVIGAYYGETITWMRRKGRIGNVPCESGFPVYTSWDLGMDDSTTIWCFQEIGREVRIINYYECSGESLEHYANWLRDTGYTFMGHYLPHDVNVKELGTGKTRKMVLEELAVRPIHKVDRPKNTDQVLDQIEQTRSFLKRAWIDESHCDKGIKALENYRKEWDEKLGTFKRTPLHNWASHGADGIRTGGVGHTTHIEVQDGDLLPEEVADY